MLLFETSGFALSGPRENKEGVFGQVSLRTFGVGSQAFVEHDTLRRIMTPTVPEGQKHWGHYPRKTSETPEYPRRTP